MSKIKHWIKEGEHQTQDFKYRVNEVRKIARTLVAFANRDGGRLLIGVKDNGKVAGIHSDEEIYMIGTAAKFFCQPPVAYGLQVHVEDGMQVLEVSILPAALKPHKAKETDGQWRAYLRISDNDVLADTIMMQYWKQMGQDRGLALQLTPKEWEVIRVLREQSPISPKTLMEEVELPWRKGVALMVRLLLWEVIEPIHSSLGIAYGLLREPEGGGEVG
jgi:predicted HTH transcriptional regulator